MSEIVKLQHANLRFKDLEVLRDIDLTVRKGQIIGLVGSNGAGKTSLLNLVNGFVALNSGGITLNGRDISRLKVSERAKLGIGRVFQESRAWRNWTVADHLAMIPKAKWQLVSETIDLHKHYHRVVFELPLLERRYLELAIAASIGSSILLIDEIGAGLSFDEGNNLYGNIKALVDNNLCQAAVIVEHKLDLLMSIVTDVCLLRDGCIVDQVERSAGEQINVTLNSMINPSRWSTLQ